MRLSLMINTPALIDGVGMFYESQLRSFLKSMSYRFIGTLATILITFTLTKKIELAVAAGIIDSFFKLILYFMHERVWQRIRYGQRIKNGCVIWLTGLSGSGKTSLAEKLSEHLMAENRNVIRLDGDDIRKYFPKLGYSKEDRNEHVKRIGLTASFLEKQGSIVIVSLISPYVESRNFTRALCQNFHEVYLTASVGDCQKRDYKGLYKKAITGEIKNFTGVSDPYEAPLSPELVLNTGNENIEKSFDQLKKYFKKISKNVLNKKVQ